ncbi:MAG: GH25 family lysozyme [Mycobacteriales bacterium]
MAGTSWAHGGSRALTGRLLAMAAVSSVFLALVATPAAADGSAPRIPPPLGPDVSSYQHPNSAPIDWPSVAGAGQRFAIVKATEGTFYTNPYYSQDVAAAQAAGLFVGSYHYAHPDESAAAQADMFAQTIGNMRDGELPPVLDLEESGGLGTAALISWTQAFLGRLQSDTGRVPMIYSYPSFWQSSMGNTTAFDSYPLWLADYTNAAEPWVPGGWSSYTLWQYTDQDSLPGIQGAVDDSQACCGQFALARLAHADPNRLYVDSLAQDVLGFPFALQTADQLDQRLNAGTLSRPSLAAQLLATSTWYAHTIGMAYWNILGRHVDPSGQRHFLDLLEAGTTDEVMRAQLAGSPEFYDNVGGGTISGFLAAAYQHLLGRPIDPSGQNAWTTAMEHGVTPYQVAIALLTSTEGRTHQIDLAYLAVLRRSVDPSGLSNWLTALAADKGNVNAMLAQLFGSSEYLTQIAETGVALPAPAPTPSPSPTPTGSPTASPTGSPSPSPTASPSPSPTASPSPTPSPSPS